MNNQLTGIVVWADLEKASKYGKYGVTITVDKNADDWKRFDAFIDELCSEDDVCRNADELTRNLGDNSAQYLNEDNDIDIWHTSDQCISFRTKRLTPGTDLTVRRGDRITLSYGASTYSFVGEAGHVEGVALYLNGLERAV